MFEILILISLIGVIKIVNEIIQSRKCPDERVLKDVVLGRFKGRDRIQNNVTRHLGICAKCRGKVEDFTNYKSEDILIPDN